MGQNTRDIIVDENTVYSYKGSLTDERPRGTKVVGTQYNEALDADVILLKKKSKLWNFLIFLLLVIALLLAGLIDYMQNAKILAKLQYQDTITAFDNNITWNVSLSNEGASKDIPMSVELILTGSDGTEIAKTEIKPGELIGTTPMLTQLDVGSHMCKLTASVTALLWEQSESTDVLVVVEE